MKCATLVSLLVALATAAVLEQTEAGGRRVREKRSDDVSMTSLRTLVEQQASAIATLRADLAAHNDRDRTLETRLQTLQNSFNAQLAALSRLQDRVAATSRAVAFSAHISSSHGRGVDEGMPLGDKQTVIFDNVFTNIGNAYSATNGMFTAPVSGSYAFFLSQMAPNHHGAVWLAIVKNGVVLDLAFAQGNNDSFDQGSSEVTTHLAAGDQVWVRQQAGDAIRTDSWTIFTGYLLQAD